MTPIARAKPHYLYIDCARGYAVLMVIACHAAYAFPGLPYPVKRLATSGWFGVQLFFLVSCVTLLMSWHSERRRTGAADIRAFFVRRVFRIAPAYYAAGALYFVLLPPPAGFDPWQALAFATFVNAWHPALTPTVAGIWNVVPGGWSIGVEFSFYACFPLFAAFVTTRRRALIAFAASLALGTAANLAARRALAGSYQPSEIGNFLFFWLPDQACVFALGGVLYFILRDAARPDPRGGAALAVASIAAFGALSFLPLGHYLGDWPPMPAGLAACLPLMGFVAGLSRAPSLFVHRAIASLGKVSFSAYLLHYAALRLFELYPAALRTQATGYAAVMAYAIGLAMTVLVTYAASRLSYAGIEQPMIDAGRRVIARMRAARPAQAAPV